MRISTTVFVFFQLFRYEQQLSFNNLAIGGFRKPPIVDYVRQNIVVLITVETGGGKTTQVAKF
jgi:HrpA-like RNA helicase